MEAITFFIYTFASIFVIVNPVAGLITVISLTFSIISIGIHL